eukprot:GGOE01036357.1.p2 GENE.GGOE01036357.1~~GGOE01036357.1.p2  ORF type:complete len:177 (-),score=47.50 GGOE01036357.1:286-816(-)
MPTLKVQQLCCHSLAPPGKKGPNTFVIVDVDGATAKTTTVKANGNPRWTEEFPFPIKDPRSCIVNFMVMEQTLLGIKTLCKHMTTVGHLFLGKADIQTIRLDASSATFSFTLLAKDFGLEAPRSSPAKVPPQPQNAPVKAPAAKWDCNCCGNVNSMSEQCLRCGVPKGVATIYRPH